MGNFGNIQLMHVSQIGPPFAWLDHGVMQIQVTVFLLGLADC
jgi:hypothetical protein